MMFDRVDFLEGLVLALWEFSLSHRTQVEDESTMQLSREYKSVTTGVMDRQQCPKCHTGWMTLKVPVGDADAVPEGIYCSDCKWADKVVPVVKAVPEKGDTPGVYTDPGKDLVREVRADGSSFITTKDEWLDNRHDEMCHVPVEANFMGGPAPTATFEMDADKVAEMIGPYLGCSPKNVHPQDAMNAFLQKITEGVDTEEFADQLARIIARKHHLSIGVVRADIQAFFGKPSAAAYVARFGMSPNQCREPAPDIGTPIPEHLIPGFEKWMEATKPVPILQEATGANKWAEGMGENAQLFVRHPSGAVRSGDTDGLAFDCLSPISILAAAGVMAEGAAKYNRGNYLKGFTFSTCYNHLMCHLMLFMLGDESEDHIGHAQWNLDRLVEFSLTRPELDDRLDYKLTTEQIQALKEKLRFKPKEAPNEPTGTDAGKPDAGLAESEQKVWRDLRPRNPAWPAPRDSAAGRSGGTVPCKPVDGGRGEGNRQAGEPATASNGEPGTSESGQTDGDDSSTGVEEDPESEPNPRHSEVLRRKS